jgi:hypothetical protein
MGSPDGITIDAKTATNLREFERAYWQTRRQRQWEVLGLRG